MAHSSGDTNSRIAAIKLLNKLALKLGKELCECFVAQEMISMADDPVQEVRKATIENFIIVCKIVSNDFFVRKLLPTYQRLAKDTDWIVREAAVHILGSIAQLTPIQIRQSTLIKIFEEFCNDKHKQVNKAALTQLGQFIYSLKGSTIPKSLLNLYILLANQAKKQDEDLVFHCAYTFPAVLSTVGASGWSMLKVTYKNLIKKNKIEIIRTMAAYIHEIAKIVGPKITTSELTLVLKNYLKDETTQTIVLVHLHDFLKVLNASQRLEYIPPIKAIIKESKRNWRQREILAINAAEYAKLFNIEVSYKEIMPIIYSLLKDEVYQVRVKAPLSFYNVIIQFESQSKYFKEAIEL